MTSSCVIRGGVDDSPHAQECIETSWTQGNTVAKARSLKAPEAAAHKGGEMEGFEFWAEYDGLLKEARIEWGRKHEILYDLNEEFMNRFLDPRILDAIKGRSMGKLKALVQQSEKNGVHKFQLFTSEFVDLFLDELAYQESSKIPMRRPNGMNRYGCLLSQLGFDIMLKALSDLVLRPLALIMFPDHIASGDMSTQYGFVVHYHPNADVNLKEHADASTVTINVCLQADLNNAPLYFKNLRGLGYSDDNEVAPTNVTLDTAGMAVIHLGQHLHGVYNVTSARSNMVIWLMGNNDYVRVIPYNKFEAVANAAEWRQLSGWSQ